MCINVLPAAAVMMMMRFECVSCMKMPFSAYSFTLSLSVSHFLIFSVKPFPPIVLNVFVCYDGDDLVVLPCPPLLTFLLHSSPFILNGFQL